MDEIINDMLKNNIRRKTIDKFFWINPPLPLKLYPGSIANGIVPGPIYADRRLIAKRLLFSFAVSPVQKTVPAFSGPGLSCSVAHFVYAVALNSDEPG